MLLALLLAAFQLSAQYSGGSGGGAAGLELQLEWQSGGFQLIELEQDSVRLELSSGIEEAVMQFSVSPSLLNRGDQIRITNENGLDLIRILDIQGRLLLFRKLERQTEIHLIADFPPGRYFVQCEGPGRLESAEILVR